MREKRERFKKFVSLFNTNNQTLLSVVVFALPAWVGSASYGLSMAFGPVCSYLINRFGNQVISMTGCVICTVSLVTSSFAPNLGVLYASFSVMYGIGLCLAYTPTMCFAGIYFDRYQTVATGIMVAGSSTGTLVLAPIAQKLVSEYGWRTAFR